MGVESTTPATNNGNNEQQSQKEATRKKKKRKKSLPTTPKEVMHTNVSNLVTTVNEKEWSCIYTDKHIPKRKNAAVAYDLVHQVYIVEDRVSSSY
jgi:hypothetical protein